MKLRFIQFVAILIWGIQADLVWFALPMGIIWEAQFFINRRWALTQQDLYRIADVTLVGLVLMLVFLFLNRAEYHFITKLLQWLPILFFPLVIVFSYSLSERMDLDVLFPSLRRQRQPINQSWDLDYLLFAMCTVASGTNISGSSFYFPLVSALICLALLPHRSSRYSFKMWGLFAAFVFLFAFMTHQGIRGAHVELKQRAQVWIANWIQRRSNPLKTQTAIGSVGQLKISDEILFRVQIPAGEIPPGLLQEASYDLLAGNSWQVMSLSFDLVEHADDFRWELNSENVSPELTLPGIQPTPMDIYLEFKYDQAIIPLPPGITEINDLPAIEVRKNDYGAVQAVGLVPSPRYQVKFLPGRNLNGPPLATDTLVHQTYQDLLEEVTTNNNLDPDHPIESIRRFFADFRYSLYQGSEMTDEPIEHFLLRSKKGHCEYYATTTVLLLRQLGIPARYVVGYSLQEYDNMIDMYVVRQRHAHAWAIAFINGEWQVIDTTPAIWAEAEADEAIFMQPLFDIAANVNFLFQVWWNEQKIEDYQTHLYAVGIILSLILAWRIYTSEQVTINKRKEENQVTGPESVGSDSPFLQLELFLEQHGYTRGPGELLAPWLVRIGMPRLTFLIPVHNQLRFDPRGISKEAKGQLSKDVNESLARLKREIETDDQS
ncbi:MAG: transglutaminase domain-containing protein [bacterium]|nr:hypothetical protein [Gammaproteobacteria bacterium]HIL96104.1 hypothetical protein [Pseudomonadales bacterium]